MRVTGGELRGRTIRVPGSGVRPTQDRVREALFSILGERVYGASFLDLFAGSGSVGLEAWSRGAAFVAWVESSRAALRVLRANVAGLCGEEVAGPGRSDASCSGGARGAVVPADAMRFLAKWLVPRPFDLIFADPPYGNRPPREKAAGGVPCVVELLGRIAEGERLAGGGWVVVEDAAGGEPVVPAGWELLKDRTYGGTRLSFYVRARGAAARQESNE